MSASIRTPKRITEGDDATEKIDAGVELVAKTVGLTMGPKGWNVAVRLGKGSVGEGKVVNTKDGVFVANQISHPDPDVDLGVEMAVETSRKTNDAAGDGTTCTVVLLWALLQEARKRVKVGSNPIKIQEGMQLEKDLVVKFIETIRKPIQTEEEVYNVALVSCQDKDIARKITDIIIEVGKYGTVGVEKQTGPLGIDLRVDRGMYYDVGYDPMLTSITVASAAGQLQKKGNASKLSWENADVGVLVFDEPVRMWQDIDHIISACVEADRRKLFIIGSFQDDAAMNLRAQYQQGILTGCVINRGIFGGETGREMLKDIALYAGATFLSPSDGTMPPRTTKPNANSILGSCTAVVTRDSFSLTNGHGSQAEIDARIALIEETIERGGLNEYDKQKYKERIARFKAGIGTITIFAPTDVQQHSVGTRVDDAVCAVRSANEEGIVAGGGVALLRCHQFLLQQAKGGEGTDIDAGRAIVRDALLMPVKKIAEMAGEEPGVRVAALMAHRWESTIGYDYWTEQECDLIKQGILDPAKVVRYCVENAVAQAGELLRTRCTIVDMPKEELEEVYLTPRQRAEKAHLRRAGQQ